MIARLRGVLIERRPDAVVIDAGGVGYLVRVTLRTLARLPATSQPVDLRTHLHVTEGALDLYGFGEPEEQNAFALLLRVSGIGPRTALQILSSTPPGELAWLIASGDKVRLRALPGIGPKTAERLIVELREAFASAATQPVDDVEAQAASALIELGMKPPQAADAVRRVRSAGAQTLESIVREALRQGVRA
mgnify:CR=1 FL=1